MIATKLPQEEALLDRFLAYHEVGVRKGHSSPMDGCERLSLGIFLHWLCKRYTIIAK